jgi:hypothetical protein
VLSSNLYGQGLTNLGTDFWFGFMPNGTIAPDYLEVYLCSNTANRIEVSEYGGGTGNPVQTYTQTLAPGQTWKVTLDIAKVLTTSTESPAYRAVHITSTNPVSCFGFSNEYASSDGFLALPTHALGKEYYTLNYNDDWYSSSTVPLAGEFMIVAPYDNTVVQITPTNNTRTDTTGLKTSHSAGTPWEVTLMKGQTYLVQSLGINKGQDITGSHILSNRTVAVLSGHQLCSIPNDDPVHQSKNHLLEMLAPIDEWGTEAYDLPMAGRTKCGDYVRLLSAEDNNDIMISGRAEVYLNAGEYVEVNFVTDPTVFSSVNHKRFVAMQYSYTESVNNDPGTADPFMCTLPPTEQFQKQMLFRTAKNTAPNGDFISYATFLGDADSLMAIVLDGHTLGSQGAQGPILFAGTNPQMGAVRVQLASAEFTHMAKSSVPFGAYIYGVTSADGYGWPAAIGVTKQANDVIAPLITPTQANCLRPSGVIRDTGSGIALIELILDSADLRGGKASYNISLATPSFETGDSVATYSLAVLDPTKAAYADLVTFDRAGNMSRYEYTYAGSTQTFPSIGTSSLSALTLGGDSCWSFSIQNKNAASETIDSIYFNGASHGILKLSSQAMTPISILANDTIAMHVCFQPADTGTFYDTLLMQYECGVESYPITARAVTGFLLTTDVDFGSVAIGSMSCKSLMLSNIGDGLLTIERDDFPPDNTEFSIDSNVVFPLVIQPHSSVTLNVCFHPTKLESGKTIVHFTTGNFPKYLHSVRDSSVWSATSSSLGVSESTSQLPGNSEIVIESLTPNPSKGDLMVEYWIKKSAPVSIAIYDERGAQVQLLQGNIVSTPGTFHRLFDLSGLPSGSYLVRISSASSVTDRKFVIER